MEQDLPAGLIDRVAGDPHWHPFLGPSSLIFERVRAEVKLNETRWSLGPARPPDLPTTLREAATRGPGEAWCLRTGWLILPVTPHTQPVTWTDPREL